MHSGIVLLPKPQKVNVCIGFTCKNLWREKYNVQNRVVLKRDHIRTKKEFWSNTCPFILFSTLIYSQTVNEPELAEEVS